MNAAFPAEPQPTYRDIAAIWRTLRERDWRVREVACVGAPRTLLVAERGNTDAPVVTLSAGLHGDEPAGVAALIALAGADQLPPQFSYRVWPCLNPTGYDARTRTNSDGVDINRTFARGGSSAEAKAVIMANRDRKFVLALDLHEDDERTAPYAYAYKGAASLFDRSFEVLEPDPAQEAEAIGGLSYSLLLIRGAAARAATLESFTGAPFAERVRWHVETVRSILRLL